MTNTPLLLTLTEDEWEERFRPITTPGNGWRQYDWTAPADKALIDEACDTNTLWTMCDCDGQLVVCQGFHLVNRLYYMIAAVPYVDNEVIDVTPDDWDGDVDEDEGEDDS